MLGILRLSVALAVAMAMSPFSVAFSPQVKISRSKHQRLFMVAPPPPPGDEDSKKQPKEGLGGMQPEEEFNLEDRGASVDWDAEWRKVVQDQKAGKTRPRPGDKYYKSEAEIAAIRAANQATEKLNRAASQLPSMPSWNSLKGDWKFWIGVLLVISFGSSLLTAQVPGPSGGSSGGSYYI
ncbi:hypothetical protein ACA910_011053 [Epithemia clementina (nom. ined.)]